MMARTNSVDVLQILNGCDLSSTIVDAYITTANAIVTDVLGDDTELSDTLKKAVEQWFAAHMIASTLWRTTKVEELGDAKVQYTGKFGENLSSTPYGQMVKQLDTTGKMGNLGKKAASIYAVTSFED